MNHISAFAVSVALIGTGIHPAPHEFRLVSFDNFGNPQPLPPGLGDLPLYPCGDGFFSINGPLDLTVLSPCTSAAQANHDNFFTSCPLITNIPGSSGENLPVAPDGDLSPNNDATSNGPRVGSERRSYLCHEPGCTWRSSFPTKQAFDRHREAKHLNIRVDCPILGCERVGDKGIKRKDNLPAHVLNKHRIRLPHRSPGD